jgi:hypothetical protein
MDFLCISYDDLRPVDGLRGKDFGHFTMILKNLLTPAALLLIPKVIAGLIYPLLVTGIAQLLFPPPGITIHQEAAQGR